MWSLRRRACRWTAPCRDAAGRRREIVVLPADGDRVVLIVPPGALTVLEPLEAGRLVGALRDAVRALDDPGPTQHVPGRHSA